MKGVFELRSPRQLFEKLEADYKRVLADPLDSFAAYDFFVTAWHLVEWKHPPATDAAGRIALLARIPVLRVCEHLAVGAKHFEADSTRHTRVSNTRSTSVWASGTWAPGTWAPGTWAGDLVVTLDGVARATLGDQLTVPELAGVVMDAWRREF
jgi:hypothetical protein